MYLTKKTSILLAAVALTLTLYFGLEPKGFHPENAVSWIPETSGIRFEKYGIVYADNVFGSFSPSLQGPGALTLEIALRPDSIKDSTFKFIAVFHGGDDADQLLIGQWRSSIIVMNGDDYDGRQRIRKLSVRGALKTQAPSLISITSGKEGTRIYLNGAAAGEAKDLHLYVPAGGKGVQVVLGNSVYGRHFWNGDIFGLTVYDTALSAEQIHSHFEKWSETQQVAAVGQRNPRALYLFDEKKGERARNSGAGAKDLEIPRRFKILSREMLDMSWREIRLNRSFVQDVVLNLAGFIPLGFLLHAVFAGFPGFFRKHGALMAIMACFVLSLSMEIAQAWMPSRSSQMLDLIMNTLGASLGAKLGSGLHS